MSTVILKGFVVGETGPSYYADGSSTRRPKLIEHERTPDGVVVSIGAEHIFLDAEAVASLRGTLGDYLEEAI